MNDNPASVLQLYSSQFETKELKKVPHKHLRDYVFVKNSQAKCASAHIYNPHHTPRVNHGRDRRWASSRVLIGRSREQLPPSDLQRGPPECEHTHGGQESSHPSTGLNL